MPIMTVTNLSKSKSGKDKVICGKDEFLLGKNCSAPPPIGAVIEADTSDGSFTAQDGKRVTLWWMNSWTLHDKQPPIEAAKAIVQAAATQNGADSKWRQDEATLRFVSNVIGNALQMGGIKAPKDIAQWANAALKASQGVLAGEVTLPVFNDEPNF
jgi:hypothetical protein